jgi:hypothetical protein
METIKTLWNLFKGTKPPAHGVASKVSATDGFALRDDLFQVCISCTLG